MPTVSKVTVTKKEELVRVTVRFKEGYGFHALLDPRTSYVKQFRAFRNVRVSSVLCLLGIGLGLGSVLLYKLYSRFFIPAIEDSGKGKKRRPCSPSASGSFPEQLTCTKLSPETPDSGISTTNVTNQTPHYSSAAVTPESIGYEGTALDCSTRMPKCCCGLAQSNTHCAAPTNAVGAQSRGRAHTVGCVPEEEFPADGCSLSCCHTRRQHHLSASTDQGFVSNRFSTPGDDAHYHGASFKLSRIASEADSMGPRSEPVDFSPGVMSSCEKHHHGNRLRHVMQDYSNSDPGNLHSTPQSDHSPPLIGHNRSCDLEREDSVFQELGSGYHRRPFLRRQTHSAASNLSCLTDFSARESLYSKGYSVDLGESLSRIHTPISNMFESDIDAESDASNMDQIHNELRQIREEIGEMNQRVQVLSSRDNLMEMLTIAPNITLDKDNTDANGTSFRVRRRQKSRAERDAILSGSRSASVSMDREVDDPVNFRRSFHYSGEYMWDYQSEFGTSDGEANFINRRPYLVGDSMPSVNANKGETHQEETVVHDLIDLSESENFAEQIRGTSLDSPDTNPGRRAKTAMRSQTFNSITDMYIDDEFEIDLEDFPQEPRRHPEGINASDEGATTTKCDYKQTGDLKNNNAGDSAANVVHEYSSSNSPKCSQCGSPSHVRPCHKSLAPQNLPLTENVAQSVSNLSACVNCGFDNSMQGEPLKRKAQSPMVGSRERVGKRKWEVKNIRSKVNIFEYVERHWKRENADSAIVKKGYHQVSTLLGMSQLRPVRGDNYCALRAALYQIVVNRVPLLEHLGPLDRYLQKLRSVFHDSKYAFLKSWDFANRLPFTQDTLLDRMMDCVTTLYTEIAEACQYTSCEEREARFLATLNFDPEADLALMEGVKLLMMLTAIELYEEYQMARSTPVFVWLMYARDSSPVPELLFRNHLNPLGDVRSVEQMDMFLLGFTLGVKLEVVRPSRYGQEDYISHYPDEGADSFPKVYLVAEDNRHYNVLLP